MNLRLDRIKNLTNKISSYEMARKENLKILEDLFLEDFFLFPGVELFL